MEFKKYSRLQQFTQTTLCFLLREKKILLAMKKRGYGEGKWNGVGGKVMEGESVEEAAVRETTEEIGVIPYDLEKRATLFFYFPHKEGPIGKAEETTVFLTRKWKGEPKETDEMRPQWFDISHLPYGEMWDDDGFWIPQVLAGKHILGEFLFDEKFHMIEKEVKEVT